MDWPASLQAFGSLLGLYVAIRVGRQSARAAQKLALDISRRAEEEARRARQQRASEVVEPIFELLYFMVMQLEDLEIRCMNALHPLHELPGVEDLELAAGALKAIEVVPAHTLPSREITRHFLAASLHARLATNSIEQLRTHVQLRMSGKPDQVDKAQAELVLHRGKLQEHQDLMWLGHKALIEKLGAEVT